jgi:hypothetical protein
MWSAGRGAYARRVTSTLTYNVESSISLAFDGAVRKQTVAFGADTLTTTGSPVNTFDGEIILINEWKRAG